MKKVLLVSVIIAFLLGGCNEPQAAPQTGIPPLKEHLIPLQNVQLTLPSGEKILWTDAYGDGMESQIVYALAVSRNNDLVIAATMNKLHRNDPNETDFGSRISALEARFGEINIDKAVNLKSYESYDKDPTRTRTIIIPEPNEVK